MAASAIGPYSSLRRRLSLAEIDTIVSARLGPTRIPGNAQPACFNRQVAMYLAARFGGWSTTSIGDFYNGRDHSTVCYGIQRIESFRESDPEVGALISELKQTLRSSMERTAEGPSAASSLRRDPPGRFERIGSGKGRGPSSQLEFANCLRRSCGKT